MTLARAGRAAALALSVGCIGLLTACETGRTGQPQTQAAPVVENRTALTEADLGVAFYPAERLAFDAASRNTKTGRAVLSMTRDSEDSVEQVYTWYRDRLGKPFATNLLSPDEPDPQANLVKVIGPGDQLEISIFRQGTKTRTVLTRRQDGGQDKTKETAK